LQTKTFSYKVKQPNYKSLKNRFKQWKKEYNQALINKIKLLSYYDQRTFLRIEDFRSMINESEKIIEITLENKARDLYLFCDSIKSLDEIKKRFPRWNRRELKKTLNQLVRYKVMFSEDDDYLSLAIRANGPKC
jgi:hypothetical protein